MEQLLSSRLDHRLQLDQVLRGGLRLVRGGGAADGIGRRRIMARQHLEELAAARIVELAVGGERVARERGARVFAALGEQRIAQADEVLRAPVDAGAAAADQLAKKARGAHRQAAALASATRRSASSPATRSRSSRYLSSTPSVLFTVSGSSVTRSSATRQFAQSMVSATPGSLKSSVFLSRCTKATTSRESESAAFGALRRRVSSSRRASG